MRIDDWSGTLERSDEVELRPGLRVRVTGLPLSYDLELRSRMPEPVPPRIGALRDHRGAVIRDASGRPEAEYDRFDATYVAAMQRWSRRLVIAKVARALRAEPRLHFETPEPTNGMDYGAYIDGIEREMQAAGLHEGDLGRLADAILRCSGLLEADARGAAVGFTGGTGTAA